MTSRIEGSNLPRGVPTRCYMRIPGLAGEDARRAAWTAAAEARTMAPRVTGDMAGGFTPIWGPEFFGIAWSSRHVWFQEMGIRPFTMHNLAGKTIPMWVNDEFGQVRAKNPKARTRVTLDGRTQTLIFRRAAQPGERKTVTRRIGGRDQEVSVPRSWPGAPGRISRREPPVPNTPVGKLGGQIAAGNVGVRWRHPGLDRRYFLRQGLLRAATIHGLEPGTILYAAEGERVRRQKGPRTP